MGKFFSRKFLITVGTWLYVIGGLVTGDVQTDVGLKAIGVTGLGYVIVEGLVDALRVLLPRKEGER